MSLNRVASIETLADHHVRRSSDAGHRPRKLSFSPVPQPWDPPQPPLNKTTSGQDHFYERRSSSPQPEQPVFDVDAGPVSAFEVPQWKRIRKSRLMSCHVELIRFGFPSRELALGSRADTYSYVLSSNLCSRSLLLVRCRHCLWLCCYQARP